MKILQLISNDEFKQKKIANYVIEGAFLQFFLSVLGFSSYLYFGLEPLMAISIPIISFAFYTFGRYIFSGVEYTNVFSSDEFRHNRKKIAFDSFAFLILFFTLSILTKQEIMGSLAIAISGGILYFITSYISLRKSFKINKEL